MTEQVQQWAALYNALHASLSALGVEDPYGDGDFWLVDDDYGGSVQKVCIHRRSFLTNALIVEIQSLLAQFHGWRVLVQFEFPIEGVAPNSSGLIVEEHRVVPHWDIALHREIAASLGLPSI